MAAIAAGLALLHWREKLRNRQHTMKILVLNAGSSSHKACLYEIAETPPDVPLLRCGRGGSNGTTIPRPSR